MEDIKKNLTISKLIEMLSHRIPDSEMFVFPETGKRYTYKEMEEKINEACRGLIAQEAKNGSHIGLWMDNIEEWYIMFFAINKIGAIAVPINSKYNEDEMDYILNKFDIDMLVMSDGYKKCHVDIINQIITNNSYPRLKKIITIGFSTPYFITYQQMIESGKNISYDEINKYRNSTYGDDICIILATSGTTGYSKGVQLTNIQLIQNGFDIGERYGLTGKDRMLIQVPMIHCFGITLSMLAAITHCTSMSVISMFNSTIALQVIDSEKITCINGVPMMYNSIMIDENFEDFEISSLKKGIMAGCCCYPEFVEKVSKTMNMKVISVYGLSEASPGCTMTSIYDEEIIRTKTVGVALPNIDCKIVNPKTGVEVEIGEEGEFIVRGYNVMMGYYNDIEETNKAIDKNGYLHTGDSAVKNIDGTFTIKGRYKDMIIRGGENIYPNEIMRVINSIDGVEDSCVFGCPDEIYGEEIFACILRNDENVTEESIRKYIKSKCAPYKVPKYIVFVDEMIKNTAGKTLTYKMKEKYLKCDEIV